MLRQLTSSQLTELECFWNIENGWGDWKQDYRIGQLTAITAEPYRDKKKKPKPYTAIDFALRSDGVRRENSKSDRINRIRKSLDMMAGKKK